MVAVSCEQLELEQSPEKKTVEIKFSPMPHSAAGEHGSKIYKPQVSGTRDSKTCHQTTEN